MKIVQLDERRRVVFVPNQEVIVYQVRDTNAAGEVYWCDSNRILGDKDSDHFIYGSGWIYEVVAKLLTEAN